MGEGNVFLADGVSIGIAPQSAVEIGSLAAVLVVRLPRNASITMTCQRWQAICNQQCKQ